MSEGLGTSIGRVVDGGEGMNAGSRYRGRGVSGESSSLPDIGEGGEGEDNR